MNINATLLGQAISFVMFVWFCMKYVWPPLMSAIEERQKKIAEGLQAAEKAEKDLQLAKTSIEDQLQQAKKEGAEVIDQANKRKLQIIDEARKDAKVERANILAQAKAEIESEQSRARDELRQQLATLVIAGTEKILERSIDANANKDILDKLTAEL